MYDYRAARESIFASDLPGSLKLVALALVEHMPNCRPSVTTLAAKCGVERKTALRSLARLERLNVIAIERQSGARSAYTLQPVPLWRTGTNAVPVPEKDWTSTNEATGPVPQWDGTGTSVGPKAGSQAVESGRADARATFDATANTQGAEWFQFPEGFKWHEATQAAAAMQGVTAAQLQEHVDYWTLHKWSRPCTNLDGELRRCIPDIRKRAEKTRYLDSTDRASPRGAAPVGNSYAWTPTQEHREYASEHGRDVATVVPQYRAAGTPDRAPSTLAAHADFMARLRHWCTTGTFIASGKLPKSKAAQERSAEQA